MKYIATLLLLLFSCLTYPQLQRINSIPKEGIVLNKGWKFHAGDYADWAKPEYDDSKWQAIDPTLDVSELPQLRQEAVGWLRVHFHVDSSLLNKPLAYHIFQSVASQVYINGTLTDSFGVVSADRTKIKEWRPSNDPKGIVFTQPEQTIAVRFSLRNSYTGPPVISEYNGFIFRISDVDRAAGISEVSHQFPAEMLMYLTFALVVSLLNFILYINSFFKRSYLLFSITYFQGAISNLLGYFIIEGNTGLTSISYAQMGVALSLGFTPFLFYLTIRAVFASGRNVMYWLNLSLTLFSLLLGFFRLRSNTSLVLSLLVLIVLATGIESTRIIVSAYRRGNKKAVILIIGYVIYWISFSLTFLWSYIPGWVDDNTFNFSDACWIIASISNPLCLIIYIAVDFADTSKQLEKKLVEVSQLSTEKQQILLSQNETLEQQVTQRTSQLNQSLQELKSTQAQLIQSEKMASLGELTAGIAHEIQNPLNFVNNFSEVNKELLEELKEEADQGNIDEVKAIANDVIDNEAKINHHGKRADAIVKGMLQHSRQTKGIKEPTDINALCDEYLSLSYHGLRAKDKNFNADFTTVFDESIDKINIVPQDVGRVLFNLFNNAFYAVNEKKKLSAISYQPSVLIQTKRVDDKVEIKVSDNGTGIPQNVIDKIFQPFFTTKPTGQGTGLGLSLAYDIVTKEHQGTITVNSRQGEGSEFLIALPG